MSDEPVTVDDRDANPVGDGRAARRERRTALVVLAVLVLVAGGIVAIIAAVHDDGPRARTGELLVADSLNTSEFHRHDVRLPWGVLTVTTGTPLTKLRGVDSYSEKHKTSYDKIAPPENGSWLPVEVETDSEPSATGPGLYATSSRATVPPTVVTLVVGGRTYPLTRSPDAGSVKSVNPLGAIEPPNTEGYLALPSTPRDPEVRVAFAGVTQVVRTVSGTVDKGRAAALDHPPRSFTSTPCDTGTVPGYRVTVAVHGACQMTNLTTSPFVAGLGWAKSDRRWLIADVAPYPPDELVRHHVNYSSDRTDVLPAPAVLRYGDLKSVASSNLDGGASGGPDIVTGQRFVFDVANGDTGRAHVYTLSIPFRAEPFGPGESSRDVRATATRHITVRG